MNTIDPNLIVYFNPKYCSYTIKPLEGEDSVEMTYATALEHMKQFTGNGNQ